METSLSRLKTLVMQKRLEIPEHFTFNIALTNVHHMLNNIHELHELLDTRMKT